MMLRSLVNEVVRRRLWPIPLLALLIAVAAPLLFMKSAPPDALDASATPPPAVPAALPNKAAGLLNTSDKDAKPRKPSKLKRQDPFAAPASRKTASADAGDGAAASTVGGETAPAQEIPVVITNSDGSTSTAVVRPEQSNPTTSTTTKPRKKPKTETTPASTPRVTTPPGAVETAAFVDVRFGKRLGTMLRYRVPRLQTFRAGGKVAAIFIGYSKARRAATFAVAASTRVDGGAECRTVRGVCRYVDIRERSYARLRLRGSDGVLVSRRLDVVDVRQLPATSKSMPRATSLTQASCLVKRLLALPASAPSISTDACE